MKNDHRVRLTKLLLHQSLLELMGERPFEKITVKELCEKADINRATFYAHYTDTGALLQEIKDEVTQAILRSVNTTLPQKNQQQTVLEICQSILENRKYCEVLFGRYGDETFLASIIGVAREQSILMWKKENPKANDAVLERLYAFISHGSVAVIRQWVQGGMTEPPEAIAAFIEGVSQAAFVNGSLEKIWEPKRPSKA